MPQASKGQALVELALVMPLLAAVVAVLFQFGVLLLVYLSLVHAGRDIGRWMAVHPDTTDDQLQIYVTNHTPSTVARANLTVEASPPCVALTNGRCTARTAGSALRIRLRYDASAHLFLPSGITVAFATFSAPTALPPYDYHVLVEPR